MHIGMEGSQEARSSHDFLRKSGLLFTDMSQGVLQGQTHSRTQVTNAFELPLLQQWGGCSHTGHRGGWLGGLPSELREDHPPSSPMGHLYCCSQARAFAFTQLSALTINKQRGLAFPLYLNTHCHSQ